MVKIEELDLYYEIQLAHAGDGHFSYIVHFENGVTDEKLDEIDKTISEFAEPYMDENILECSKGEDNVKISFDSAGVSSQNKDTIIYGLLKTLNNISGITSVTFYAV